MGASARPFVRAPAIEVRARSAQGGVAAKRRAQKSLRGAQQRGSLAAATADGKTKLRLRTMSTAAIKDEILRRTVAYAHQDISYARELWIWAATRLTAFAVPLGGLIGGVVDLATGADGSLAIAGATAGAMVSVAAPGALLVRKGLANGREKASPLHHEELRRRGAAHEGPATLSTKPLK